jgi:hypothetical protein
MYAKLLEQSGITLLLINLNFAAIVQSFERRIFQLKKLCEMRFLFLLQRMLSELYVTSLQRRTVDG